MMFLAIFYGFLQFFVAVMTQASQVNTTGQFTS